MALYRVIPNTVFPRAGTIISCRTGTQSEGLIRTGGGVGGGKAAIKSVRITLA